MALVNGVLQSDAKIQAWSADMDLYRPEEARREFKGKFYLSKPTFYKWIREEKIRKYTRKDMPGLYWIQGEEIERVKKLIRADAVNGTTKFTGKKDSKGGKKR